MAHMRKIKMSEAVHLCKHYERNSNIRSYGNSDVDMSRSCENYNLAPDRGNQISYIKSKLQDIDHVKRKDLVVLCDLIITIGDGTPIEYQELFFKTAYDWAIRRYGEKSGLNEDVIVSAYTHLDETTPHMHIAILPVIMDSDGKQRFCAKEFFDRKELKSLHDDLQHAIENAGVPGTVKNGKTRYDSNGRALSIKELKRETYKDQSRWNVSNEKNMVVEQNKGRW